MKLKVKLLGPVKEKVKLVFTSESEIDFTDEIRISFTGKSEKYFTPESEISFTGKSESESACTGESES